MLRVFSVILVAVAAMSSAARAGIISVSATAPTPGVDDVYQLSTTGQTTVYGTFNYYTDNSTYGAPGTLFTTGSNPAGYEMTAFTISIAGSTNSTASDTYTAYLFSDNTTATTVTSIYTDTTSTSVNIPGTSQEWLTFSFATPQLLSPSSSYAFAIHTLAGGGEYSAVGNTHPYLSAYGPLVVLPTAGGSYSGVGYQNSTYSPVFDVALSPVPEPSSLALGIFATAGLLTARRFRGRDKTPGAPVFDRKTHGSALC